MFRFQHAFGKVGKRESSFLLPILLFEKKSDVATQVDFKKYLHILQLEKSTCFRSKYLLFPQLPHKQQETYNNQIN